MSNLQAQEPNPDRMIIGLDAVESLVEAAQTARYELGESYLGDQLQDAIDRVTDAGHVIEFDADGWAIQHPLRCRPAMLDCAMHRLALAQVTELPAGVASPGRYILTTQNGELCYESLR